MARRQYSNTAAKATLSGAAAAVDTSLTLSSFTGYPAVPFTGTISRGEADEEVVLVTAISGGTLTVIRGFDGTTSKSHTAGASFTHTTVAKDFDEANAHVNATVGVHGIAGSLVGTTDVQTLSNKTLTAPTLAGATLSGSTTGGSLALSGSLSAASASVTGNAVVGGTLAVTGNASVGGTLGVTGAATLASGSITATPTSAAHIVRKDYADGLNSAMSSRVGKLESLVYASVHRTVDQSIAANTWTTVLCDSEDLDPSGIHAPATGRFTAPIAGVYQLSGTAFFGAGATTGQDRATRWAKNGTLIDGTRTFETIANAGYVHQSTGPTRQVTLAAGDYVTFEVWHNANVSLAARGSSNATGGDTSATVTLYKAL